MLIGTRRSHNLSGLGYSPQKNISISHKSSTSKNNFQNHAYKKNHHNNHRHAPNKYYHYRANHAGISYNSVSMTRARYERINNKFDFTIFHEVQNTYRRFRYGITIQPKDFKAMWVPKLKPIRLKAIWVPKTIQP